MLDLPHFIFNCSSTTESITAQCSSGLELTDDSVDDDSLIINPSSFVFLFAEILTNSSVSHEPDSDADSSASDLINTEELTDKKSLDNNNDGLGIERLISTKNQLSINGDISQTVTDNQVINSQYQTDTTVTLLDIPFKAGMDPKAELLPLNALENNVAMAWINSDSFEPPQPVSDINELGEEIVPELALKEPSEIKLKQDVSLLNDKTLDLIDSKLSINAKEEWSEHFQLSESTSFSQINRLSLSQESSADSTPTENDQYLIQPGASGIRENQRAMEPPIKSLEIPVDLTHSQWADKFSEHILWLGHQGIKSALIKIHPEELGLLEISIKVVKDSASVNINSHSSQVRDLLDQAIPKLREMMSEQGLNLSDVHIGSDANPRQFSHHNASSAQGLIMDPDEEVSLTPLSKRAQEGIIDYFA